MAVKREKIISIEDVQELAYNLYAEADTVGGIHILKFVSTWVGDKNESEAQTKFSLLLNEDSLTKLKNFINSL